jgi:uracil-DNA glycosylase family 4
MLSEDRRVLPSAALSALEARIRRCRKCRLWVAARNAVPGEGPAGAKVVLIGQNPGTEEDKTGRPFMGRSGKFLDTVLKYNGISRESVFITNIVKHRTPGNRLPLKDEVSACKDYILEQMEFVRPRIIVLMGTLAWKEAPRVWNTEYIMTFHPAAAMRFPKMREKFESDFELLKRRMKRMQNRGVTS